MVELPHVIHGDFEIMLKLWSHLIETGRERNPVFGIVDGFLLDFELFVVFVLVAYPYRRIINSIEKIIQRHVHGIGDFLIRCD